MSPLILVLNTLVAEFLYAQNCHFCLSVFATEGLLPLPDFEKSNNFRFNESELNEIFQLIGLPTQISNEIAALYIKPPSNDVNTSLLYYVIKIMVQAKIKISKIIPSEITQQSELPNRIKSSPYSSRICSCNTRKHFTDETYFQEFNTHLKLLSHQVFKLIQYVKVHQQNIDNPRYYTQLNQNLERITENVRHLTKSDEYNNNIGTFMQNITDLIKEMAQFVSSFEKVFLAKDTPHNTQSYSDWVWHLKTSKNGQKFIGNMEVNHKQAMLKETEQLRSVYESKMEQNRIILKLYYKQKMIEKCRKVLSTSSEGNKEQIQQILNSIDTKLKLSQGETKVVGK